MHFLLAQEEDCICELWFKPRDLRVAFFKSWVNFNFYFLITGCVQDWWYWNSACGSC